MKRAAAVLAVAVWAAMLAGQWQATSHDHPVHLPHAVAAAIGPDSAAMMLDHPHVTDNSATHLPESFTAAVLPRTTVNLAALSVVALVVGCAVLCACAMIRVDRGPPDPHRIPLAGRTLLDRICISRR